MIWNSVGDFFAMGGYGLYVWGSFGACALAFLAEPLLIRMRHNQIRSNTAPPGGGRKTGNGKQVKRWKKRAAIIGGGLAPLALPPPWS
jgi:heme exporter protein D